MDIKLKKLFEAKFIIEKALEQYWSDTTKQELKMRLARINAAIVRVTKINLVGG